MVKAFLFHGFVCSPRALGASRPVSFFVFCALLLSFSFSQTKEANTSADEPLTTKEGAHLQDIDGLAAIVGDKTILKSDINQTLAMAIFQRQLNPQTDIAEIQALKKEIIQSIINRKIILIMAELDSVEVKDKDVDRSLDDQVNNIIAQAGEKKPRKRLWGNRFDLSAENIGMK